MSVAAANDWYHAERRVMSKRQRRRVSVQRRRPRCRRFESFGWNFFIIFFALCIMEKIVKKIEGNVGTAFDLSFPSLLIFSDPIEIRLGSVTVFNSKTFKTGFGVAIRQVYLQWGFLH